MARLKDRWHDLCKLVEKDDGLPTRNDVGDWTEEKLWFWNRYIDITTRAMVGHPKWPSGIVYVDLFSGPGICTCRDTGKRIPGSPLIAAHAPKPFFKIIVCEQDTALAEACEKRLFSSETESICRVFHADCNKVVKEIASEIPDRTLTLAFIDPTGLHAAFDTIRILAARGNVDLLVLFADGHDIVRNVKQYFQQGNRSKLDLVMGPDSRWREAWEALPNRTSLATRRLFADLYTSQLAKHLGYQVFGEKVMKAGNTPIYRLIYASKHERGLEFWDKITKKDPSGQKRLF